MEMLYNRSIGILKRNMKIEKQSKDSKSSIRIIPNNFQETFSKKFSFSLKIQA